MRILLLTIFSLVATYAHAGAAFTFSETPGSFAVGFRVLQQYDSTRTFGARIDAVTGTAVSGNPTRPVQTLIWYPAAQSGTHMRYRDYLVLSGSEERFDRSDEQINTVTQMRLRDYLPADMSAETLAAVNAQPMSATQAAPAAAGRFPVVIYAPSFGASAFENADLCEFLASHGYVVLASPSMGADSRWMTFDLPGIQAQVGDIQFLIGYAASLSNTDSTRVAVIGYSWGGISNVFAAAKDTRITALVGLDGGIRLVGKLVSAANDVTPDRITVPYLYLSSDSGSFEDLYRQKQDLSDDLLARLKYSDLYVVTLLPLVHYHFASEHLRFLSTRDRIVFPGDYSLQEIFQGYGWIARYSLSFLDGALKNDVHALAFVTNEPTANGLSPHQVKVEINRRSGPPLTRESLAEELGRRGFGKAREVYERMQKQDADFKLRPIELANWVDALLVLHRSDDAIRIAELFAQTYPQNPWAYEELGESHLAHGERSLGVENLKKVLAMDPSSKRIERRLEEIGMP